MKTAAVVIDDWKLEVYKKRLDDAGYKYTESAGIIEGTTTLKVEYDFVANLKSVVEAAGQACLLIKK